MTLVELADLYNTNKDFKEYVNKYAKCHRRMIGDTRKIKVVQNYAEWLRGGKR